MAVAVINDDYCGISFAYGVSSDTEMLVMVEGLGSIWSSMARPTVPGWTNLTVLIDLQDVQVLGNRSISFVARFAASSYAALDNITLHPCIDCATPGTRSNFQSTQLKCSPLALKNKLLSA